MHKNEIIYYSQLLFLLKLIDPTYSIVRKNCNCSTLFGRNLLCKYNSATLIGNVLKFDAHLTNQCRQINKTTNTYVFFYFSNNQW